MIQFNFNSKVRILQLVNHILLLVGIVYAAITDQWNLLWWSLGGYMLMLPLGTVCGLHRLLSHRAYKTSKFWEWILSIFSIYGTIGSTITWVALHRFHHMNTEKPNDPHSPYIHRENFSTLKFDRLQAFKSWIGWWSVAVIPPKIIIDLIHDPFHSFIHRHYFKIIFITCALLALINPWLIIFAYAIPACLTLHATSVIIVVAHLHGYKTHQLQDESTNTWIGSLITLGDGWHNNHHANPGKWNYREKWWEIDPCSWIIRLIKKD